MDAEVVPLEGISCQSGRFLSQKCCLLVAFLYLRTIYIYNKVQRYEYV